MSVIVIPEQLTVGDSETLVDLAIHAVDPALAALLGDQEFSLAVSLPFDQSPQRYYQLLQEAVQAQLASWGSTVLLNDIVIPGWRELEYDQGYSLTLNDDFTRFRTSVDTIGELGWEPSLSAASITNISLLEHIGVIRLATTADSGFARIHHGLWSISRVDYCRFIFRLPTATTRVRYQVGLGPFTTPGCMLLIQHDRLSSDSAGGNWQVISRINAVDSSIDSGLPVLSNQWYEGTISRQSASLAAVTLLNLTSGAVGAVSNRPIDGGSFDSQLIGPYVRVDRGLAGGTRSIDIDEFSMAVRGLERT